jgi:hypothetical protein
MLVSKSPDRAPEPIEGLDGVVSLPALEIELPLSAIYRDVIRA